MIRIKTLSLPLISAAVASVALPAGAQVRLELSSQKAYRQDKDSVDFKGGTFKIAFGDGTVTSVFRCNDPNYFPPGRYTGACSPGTTGYLYSGSLNGATEQRPYLTVTSLQQALVVAPLEANRILLTAAPASKLARPLAGFQDDSVSIFFNLTVPDSIKEYGVTRYYRNYNYTKSQRTKFDEEIVPGVYHYSFPRLGFPHLPAVIKAEIYPMAEGLITKHNQTTGFEFTGVNDNQWSNGFLEMSYSKPNVIKWKGLTPSVVFATVDKLFFSMRALRNPNDPRNSEVILTSAIFPAFTDTASDSRVLLANPYVNSFTVPPIFPTGTTAMVQLDLERNFQTGGVTYDFSKRRFQIPVVVVDSFSEYASVYLGQVSDPSILADSDGDGFNNLNEWILDSDAADEGSVPIAPYPAAYQAVDIVGGPTPFGSYFGFNVNLKKGTDPGVKYTLQRSLDQGKTWQTFVSDANWTVERVTTVTRGITTREIRVRSTVLNTGTNIINNLYMEPPGTAGDIYRVKITLAK